ncbi:hypothetical protein GCM10020254_59010 [Streptomyces goshikiensis]
MWCTPSKADEADEADRPGTPLRPSTAGEADRPGMGGMPSRGDAPDGAAGMPGGGVPGAWVGGWGWPAAIAGVWLPERVRCRTPCAASSEAVIP